MFATASPHEALTLFEEQPEGFDLVITDVIMPGMNGPEMIKRMLERRSGLKYLFISGHASNLIGEQGFAEDILHCIPKPFTFETLAKNVRAALASG